jgi:hypothetical protein
VSATDDCATARAGARGAGADSNAVAAFNGDLTAESANAQVGKALAVLLYNIGAASLSATLEEFRQHPPWRSA